MRINKAEATQFIDAKIAQFKELDAALDEGTFSLETYRIVYEETYYILSRLFSENELDDFRKYVGTLDGSQPVLSRPAEASAPEEKKPALSQPTGRAAPEEEKPTVSRPAESSDSSKEEKPSQQDGDSGGGLSVMEGAVIVIFGIWVAKEIVEQIDGIYNWVQDRKHPEAAAKRKAEKGRSEENAKRQRENTLKRAHLQKCISRLELYRKLVQMTGESDFEFNVEELISIRTRQIHAEQNASLAIGKGNEAKTALARQP